MTTRRRVAIVGGGAAGFFAAITCAEAAPAAEVSVFEKGPQFLSKVRISGGGRCNVTHACFDARTLSAAYPRGERALIGLFKRFQPRDTIDWFEARGVTLKTESDGRIFPTTDSSQTIIDCLMRSAKAAGVQLITNRGAEHVARAADGSFIVTLSNGDVVACDRLLLATGGARTPHLAHLAAELGHGIESPVPSLFTFIVAIDWLRGLAGVATDAAVSAPGTGLRARGPLLITHTGVSGPAILRLSAWGARALHGLNYTFPLHVNWLPDLNEQQIDEALRHRQKTAPARLVANVPIPPLTARLWASLVAATGVPPDLRWAGLSRVQMHMLVQQLSHAILPVTGKSLNKDEFVTCGGVRLGDVNLKSMESRLCPGLFFAGELLDIDGITGGYNFQAAWTTGWIAGHAMAAEPATPASP